MVDWRATLGRLVQLLTREFEMFLAIAVGLLGLILAVLLTRLVRRGLQAFDIPDAVEGTPFERTANRLGTSSVSLLARLTGLFVLTIAVLISLRIVGVLSGDAFGTRFTGVLSQAFIAVVVVIVGLLAGDKAEVAVSERLRSVKLAEVTLLPTLVKYSVFYVAGLIALSQLGVATTALLVLLAAYAFGLFFLSGLAFKPLLAASAAGMYILLNEPYSIGDEVEIDGHRGIVQEMDVFVTHIESEGEEFIVPNHRVFESGITRVRE